MRKPKMRIIIPHISPRQPMALVAKTRRAGKMKHRSTPRGGQTNGQADIQDMIDSEYGDDE